MRLLGKISVILLLLIVVFWAGLAVYFSYIDRNKTTFESHLTSYFGRKVTIGELATTWQGLSPKVIVEDFRVHPNDKEVDAPMAFESLEASLSLMSIFRFWPEFTEFSVVKPSIEIVSINANQISIGGIKFSFDGSSGSLKPKTVVRWLLDQSATNWSDGSIVWQRQSGERVIYKDISFNFVREQENRSIVAGFTGSSDEIAFKAQSHGNLLSANDWGASLEIIDGEGQAVVSSEDFSLEVNNGQGAIRLKNLEVKKIQDFIALSGLANKAKWLSESEVNGYLHGVALEFSGSLFAITDWELHAQASEFGFKSRGDGASVTNLAGQVDASFEGGRFLFSTEESTFKWQEWFDAPFNIKSASGEFAWKPIQDGELEVSLQRGRFDDGNSQISNINVESLIKSGKSNIKNFAQLFKVDSVADLDYEDGRVVESANKSDISIDINASADFTMEQVTAFNRYLPKLDNLELLRSWWARAFTSGSIESGKVSFQGPISKDALNSGKSLFSLSSDFNDIGIDYAAPLNWPKIEKGNGSFTIENQLFNLTSNDAYIGGDKITDLSITIPQLFKKKLILNIDGNVTKSLSQVLDFIFKGPLIAKDKQLAILPIRAEKGEVDLSLKVQVPLTDLNSTTVQGSGLIKNALAFLPNNVPIEFANSRINFTEKSVEAKQIGARFLGGQVVGDLVTIEEAQPPIFQINAQGSAQIKLLKPWVGEQVLGMTEGVANWRGSLLVDNNNLSLHAQSDLQGVTVTAPAPLAKEPNVKSPSTLSMKFGAAPNLSLTYDQVLGVDMQSNQPSGRLFDKTLIRVVDDNALKPVSLNSTLAHGVNVEIHRDDINLDQYLEAIVDLASVELTGGNGDTAFIDAMKSISVKASDPTLLNRKFGAIDMLLTSPNGADWAGDIEGQNIAGALHLKPSENNYELNLSRLLLVDAIPNQDDLPPIDYGLDSSNYPNISVVVNEFVLGEKKFGRLQMEGGVEGDAWLLKEFEMERNGVITKANGKWFNNEELGSLSSFDFETQIQQAETAMDDFSFNGFVKKGSGSVKGNLNWIGSPHEFDFSRLNGDYDLLVEKGELVKIEPGGGKLLGLLNFNAVARRLSLDFSDVFAGGLVFDRMQYKGQFSDGKAIMQEAYILSPAAFIRMEGQVDIAKEMIDMEIHMSPELGGNLALLSGLANPAAGALVFLTQRVFKEELRDANFTSYRALGTWKEFEIEQFNAAKQAPTELVQSALVTESAERAESVEPVEPVEPEPKKTLLSSDEKIQDIGLETSPQGIELPTSNNQEPAAQDKATQELGAQ